MSWTAGEATRRTFDPAAGLELIVVSSGSDGRSHFSIVGGDHPIEFAASTERGGLLPDERRALAVAGDVVVWTVFGDDRAAPDDARVIVAALCAFKSGHGFRIGEERYLVRLGVNGPVHLG